MIKPSTIYWIAQCDCIRDACIPIIIFGILLSIVGIAISSCMFYDPEERSRGLRWASAAATFAVVAVTAAAILGRTFVPTSRTMAAMYVIPAVANNEKVQDMGGKVYDLAVEWLEELKPPTRRGEQK